MLAPKCSILILPAEHSCIVWTIRGLRHDKMPTSSTPFASYSFHLQVLLDLLAGERDVSCQWRDRPTPPCPTSLTWVRVLSILIGPLNPYRCTECDVAFIRGDAGGRFDPRCWPPNACSILILPAGRSSIVWTIRGL